MAVGLEVNADVKLLSFVMQELDASGHASDWDILSIDYSPLNSN
jgi:hypothetical protein